MSVDFFLLLATAFAAAFGAWAAMRVHRKTLWTAIAVLVFLLVGVHTVWLIVLSGDGRLLPGLQLNPAIKAHWQVKYMRGAALSPHPMLNLFVLLAPLAVLIGRPARRCFFLPLPAVLYFLTACAVLNTRTSLPATRYERAFGPDAVGHLTVAPRDAKGAHRLVFASGADDDTFLRVRAVHTTTSKPPALLRLFWTKDGEGLVFAIKRRRLFAVDTTNNEGVGDIPSASHEWPSNTPGVESNDVRRRFSEAAKEVAIFVKAHGGIHVP